jgi:hypothetical protein
MCFIFVSLHVLNIKFYMILVYISLRYTQYDFDICCFYKCCRVRGREPLHMLVCGEIPEVKIPVF